MPLYDYQCHAGHTFEKVVPLAKRQLPIECEGLTDGGPPCMHQASRVEISHAHPSALLDYGLAANRDAAREGRYDPNRPSKRGVRKVQL